MSCKGCPSSSIFICHPPLVQLHSKGRLFQHLCRHAFPVRVLFEDTDPWCGLVRTVCLHFMLAGIDLETCRSRKSRTKEVRAEATCKFLSLVESLVGGLSSSVPVELDVRLASSLAPFRDLCHGSMSSSQMSLQTTAALIWVDEEARLGLGKEGPHREW